MVVPRAFAHRSRHVHRAQHSPQARQQAVPALKQKLGGYLGCWSGYYIGSSSNYSNRWERHRGNGWRKMVVLYEAWSAGIAADIERELITWSRGTGFRVEGENRARGGEGILGDRSRHHIYVLVR